MSKVTPQSRFVSEDFRYNVPHNQWRLLKYIDKYKAYNWFKMKIRAFQRHKMLLHLILGLTIASRISRENADSVDFFGLGQDSAESKQLEVR